MSIHFIIPRYHSAFLTDRDAQRLPRGYPYWLGGPFNWAAQSWLVLREFREDFSIGTDPRPGVVNFGHSLTWRSVGLRAGEFRVSVRADYRRVFDVDFEILQNPTARLSLTQAYLPYWPIPGQMPRRSARQGLRTIAYAGRIGRRNLTTDVVTGDWRTPELSGLTFVVVPPEKWHDMSEIDLLVAIRSFDRRTYPEKPPSKLFNAWRSSIPLVGGFDSAFSAVGTPGVNYVRVSSINEFTQAVIRLRDDKAFYDRIVDEGRKQAPEVSHERLALSWLDVFDRQIMPAYEVWLKTGGPKKVRPIARIFDRTRNLASAAKARVPAVISCRKG